MKKVNFGIDCICCISRAESEKVGVRWQRIGGVRWQKTPELQSWKHWVALPPFWWSLDFWTSWLTVTKMFQTATKLNKTWNILWVAELEGQVTKPAWNPILLRPLELDVLLWEEMGWRWDGEIKVNWIESRENRRQVTGVRGGGVIRSGSSDHPPPTSWQGAKLATTCYQRRQTNQHQHLLLVKPIPTPTPLSPITTPPSPTLTTAIVTYTATTAIPRYTHYYQKTPNATDQLQFF